MRLHARIVFAAAILMSATGAFAIPNVTVRVDHEYCATGGVQCSGTGLTPGVAVANTNRNPVRVAIQVMEAGAPVTTVTDPSITIVSPLFPAGGSAVMKYACTSCFLNVGNGIYTIFLNPIGTGNWKSGSYFVQVLVTTASGTARELIRIDIPF